MEIVWAPWRMSYITSGEKPQGCVFCSKSSENRDAVNTILYRGRQSFVILNAYPYSPGHLMVVPYRHLSDISQLSDEEAREFMDITRRCVRILTAVIAPQGLNIGVNQGEAAGAGIADHLHQHIVPRWSGDTNFMTSVGHTKVLPELVDQTYAKLRPSFEEK